MQESERKEERRVRDERELSVNREGEPVAAAAVPLLLSLQATFPRFLLVSSSILPVSSVFLMQLLGEQVLPADLLNEISHLSSLRRNLTTSHNCSP